MNGIAKVSAISLTGLEGNLVTVEGAVGRQLPGMNIVGLPDIALSEAKQRVRQAAAATGLDLNERFVLINLQPADLPKHGSSFDLSIAIAALVALRKLPGVKTEEIIHIGELGLDGRVKRPRGLLTSVNAAKSLGYKTVMVPSEAAAEASLISELKILAVDSLKGAINWYLGRPGEWAYITNIDGDKHKIQVANKYTLLEEVIGQDDAIEALKVSAAGRHHIHMSGPPGSGKTLLARALPTLLPALTREESVTLGSLKALNHGEEVNFLDYTPPFESPHHTASSPAIIGTAQGGWIRPGAISQASFGVLFLDEVQEFPTKVLDTLRQPLESGKIQIHRAFVKATLPARVQLVMASNPCPCGFGGSVKTIKDCTCSPNQIRSYNARISGPLLDRIDIRIRVERVSRVDVKESTYKDKTIKAKQLIKDARGAALERYKNENWSLNSEVPGFALRSKNYHPGKKAVSVLDRALEIGNLTLRGYERVLRLAWSVCDLRGGTVPSRQDVVDALTLRERDRTF